MAERRPDKPTESFGHISFAKDGSVTKHSNRLSSNKETQEFEAIQFFAKGLEKRNPNQLVRSVQQLPESGQDFLLETSLGEITVQLTELVTRAYARPLTRDEYNKGNYKEYIQKEYGAIPWGVDTTQRDSALCRLIEKKIQKHYAKDSHEKLWLVVFTTSAFYQIEYFEAGEMQHSPALLEARKYLKQLQQTLFDEIWFTNLQTAPIRIWPILDVV